LAQEVTVIQGAGVASAINAFQFAGAGDLRIGPAQVSETSLTSLLSLAPGPGHSLVGTSTHTLDFGALGTYITLDEVSIVPIVSSGLHKLSIRAEIVGGTGSFAGATGQLSFNGFANLATGQVTWMVHGHYR
jgi:hypothetical protein